jgi:F-type H+-transporting ATPase subunit b
MLHIISVLASTAEAAAPSGNPAENIIKGFHVEWIPLGAAVLNVCIVLFVLKRYAFGPITAMLEQRRQRIADGEEKLKQIERQLAESELHTAEAIAKANSEAQRLINEAKESATAFTERKAQEAIASAQQILAKAETAAKAERDQIASELKRDFARLLVNATTQVTGKVLTSDDQKRINEQALASVEA